MTVQPISDEELAELEGYSQHTAYLGDEDAAITMGELRGLIARLRAAEADAKRYRWLRGFERGGITVRDLKSHLHVEGLDAAIDEAMEHTP
ncbi:hypothetical protein [Pseudomonas aeruginosa]|uniref:hypothetical protein n=1 Tax=Pseudomonas aeruginosa TaxID=287 RepID=UPI0003C36065|nr:hypothetical protein [Pseudomonas aeruginosa]ESR68948.1 hypothetical protein T266_23085 [Pseudomonas aeruginosa VRFPA05]MBM2732006.1 hypothetical protein [Pseudomonas aeruginosa]MBP1353115.1 hypothetical protein [Pseudomonas aeruginosa]MBP1359646.1 hypothetical protein [Pseudomonas aeruginosa]HBP5922668.1 hypothetical protein [Pseudomonas aeruginosa]